MSYFKLRSFVLGVVSTWERFDRWYLYVCEEGRVWRFMRLLLLLGYKRLLLFFLGLVLAFSVVCGCGEVEFCCSVGGCDICFLF